MFRLEALMTLDVLVEGFIERFGPHAPALFTRRGFHFDSRDEFEVSLDRVWAFREAACDASRVLQPMGILIRRSVSRLCF